MPNRHWDNLKEVFHSALALPPNERASYLDEACIGNESLRRAVESLIKSHEETGNFVDEPALQAAAEMLVEGDFQPRQVVGHYRMIAKIGEGGMGHVFLAEDTTLNRKASLKFLSRTFTDDRERIFRVFMPVATSLHPTRGAATQMRSGTTR